MKESAKNVHVDEDKSSAFINHINSLERGRKHRDKIINLGLCVRCKKPNPRTTTRCKECTREAVAANADRIARLDSNKQCVICFKPWCGATLRCDTCREATNLKWRNKSLSDVCTRCAKPRDDNGKTCSACREEQRMYSRKRRAKNARDGLCVQCKSCVDTPTGKLCKQCIFKAASRRWLGDSGRWRELLALIEKQSYKCAYTNEPIEIGGNASVDHKTPRSDGGKNTIENLQWVEWRINRMKTDIPHDEFLRICIVISINHMQSEP